MISKPLFKQSMKANRGMWFFVTFITCSMLAILILVLGNLNIDQIRGSMSDVFIKNSVESQAERQSMTYFHMSSNALDSYESNVSNVKTIRDSYLYLTTVDGDGDPSNGNQPVLTKDQAKVVMTTGKTESESASIITIIDEVEKSSTNFDDTEISNYVLNQIADAFYNELVIEEGEEAASTAKQFISKAITDFNTAKMTNSSLTTTEFATNYIPEIISNMIYEQVITYDDKQIEVSSLLTKETLYSKSSAAIISFRSQMSIKEEQITKEVNNDENFANATEEQKQAEIQKRLEMQVEPTIQEISTSLMEELPENVSNSLSELGSMNIYELVIGSIFFKIAGLLLPIIYIIMVSNNLIAGQVDSGSMAYVLSTPIKRRKVITTQMSFLILSILAMSLCTTIVGVSMLAIVGTDKIDLTYLQLLELNLGAFITMIAISGICFLASSWFNRSKNSMSYGGGLSMFFLVATILGLFGSEVIPSAMRIDAMKYFNYVSLISLFDTTAIFAGESTYMWKLLVLVGVAVVTYTISAFKFDKKDLPL